MEKQQGSKRNMSVTDMVMLGSYARQLREVLVSAKESLSGIEQGISRASSGIDELVKVGELVKELGIKIDEVSKMISRVYAGMDNMVNKVMVVSKDIERVDEVISSSINDVVDVMKARESRIEETIKVSELKIEEVVRGINLLDRRIEDEIRKVRSDVDSKVTKLWLFIAGVSIVFLMILVKILFDVDETLEIFKNLLTKGG